MDFAPYQDTAPDQQRAFSPSPPPRRDISHSPPPGGRVQRNIAANLHKPSDSTSSLPPPSHFNNDIDNDAEEWDAGNVYPPGPYATAPQGNSNASGGFAGTRSHVNLFETSLPMRLDYEAVVAYLLLPPAGAVFLLLIEHKSDYVRFHAWQSALLFTAIFILHVIFSFSTVVSWILFSLDILLIGGLSYKAYQDADNLDRFEVPFIGPIASNWVDAE